MSDSSWEKVLTKACNALDVEYQAFLEEDKHYFPSKSYYLNAFKTLPKKKVKYILFGQDPYPREDSAGGYAFIDMKVQHLFSSSGLSIEVNRATSLRNFMKMTLVASGQLTVEDTSQESISQLNKTNMIDSIEELRLNFEKNGVLLLNTALIFTDKKSSAKHVKAWRPFMKSVLLELQNDDVKLILFGSHAKELKKHLPLENFETIEIEHPYNHTFISNPKALELFAPMKLLEK